MTSSDDDAGNLHHQTGNLWPTTRGAVKLIDGLHSATGLPWWATLSLTALGVRAALLPFTLKQMRASTALMAEWRLANRTAAMRHAQTGAPPVQSSEASSATSTPLNMSPLNGATSKGSYQAAATAASKLSHEGQSSAAASLLPQAEGVENTAQMRHRRLGHPQSESRERAARLGDVDEGDEAQPDEGTSRGMDTGQAQRGLPSLGSIWEEYRRIREGSRAPRALWLVGSPLVQLSVFGTSVFAARHMAACNWPGFASEGLLWCPDLTKAAAVIHWGQGVETIAVAFPYGQLGVVLPVAISLALFANINLGLAQPPGAQKPSGDGAVMAYMMGALRTAMEWAIVPVLAVAMCLPHGALVYWLSSSMVSLAQTALLRQPAVRSALQLPTQKSEMGSGGRAWAAAGAAVKPAAAQLVDRSIDQLFLQAAESKALGNAAHALHIISAIRAQQPLHARAHFAAGQLHADLQQWQLAEEAYMTGARLEPDLAKRARCYLGAGQRVRVGGEVPALLRPGPTECKLLPCSAGVAQHQQGDLEAALQAFASASADALSAAGLSEAALSSQPAASCIEQTSAYDSAFSGAGLAEADLSSQSAVSSSSGAGHETLHSGHGSGGSMAGALPASLFRAEHGPCSSSGPTQEPPDSGHANRSSRGEVDSGAQSQSDAAASSDGSGVQASALAERTAVRALMAQASVLKRLGKPADALHALTLAAVLDRGAEVHAQKLQAEMNSNGLNKTVNTITEA